MRVFEMLKQMIETCDSSFQEQPEMWGSLVKGLDDLFHRMHHGLDKRNHEAVNVTMCYSQVFTIDITIRLRPFPYEGKFSHKIYISPPNPPVFGFARFQIPSKHRNRTSNRSSAGTVGKVPVPAKRNFEVSKKRNRSFSNHKKYQNL